MKKTRLGWATNDKLNDIMEECIRCRHQREATVSPVHKVPSSVRGACVTHTGRLTKCTHSVDKRHQVCHTYSIKSITQWPSSLLLTTILLWYLLPLKLCLPMHNCVPCEDAIDIHAESTEFDEYELDAELFGDDYADAVLASLWFISHTHSLCPFLMQFHTTRFNSDCADIYVDALRGTATVMFNNSNIDVSLFQCLSACMFELCC